MRMAVFPGSFDPMTNGHLDIVKRASVLFDEVIVAVGNNMNKNSLFTPEERFNLVKESVENIPNVKVCIITGLVVTHAKELGANWINVNDGKGASSPALGIYNVTTLPAMFIFNKEGKVVARDLFDTEKLKSKISAIL